MSNHFDPDRLRLLLRSHPESAINLLVKHYRDSLVNIARTFTNDVNLARDIVQETFAHVWEKHKSLSQDHEKTIDNYLVQVVRYKSISAFKKNLKISDLKQQYIKEQPTSDESIDSRLIKAEIISTVRQLISTFPSKERQCLELKIDQELTNAQIAEKLNVSVKAVERSLTSAYKRLRRQASVYL